MRIYELDGFMSNIPWNQTWYGAPCHNGHWVWSASIHDILKYPGRVKWAPFVEQPFGLVRQRLLQAAIAADPLGPLGRPKGENDAAN